ncbi:MAG: aminotransferase class V-fold PLP-dependent enzyme, partial [Sphaerochaetaceae bacterium]|nr:aminotransferase class V-fold PLP-dependent enzyme [Sphaerochaetaceae bacterium]
MKQFYFDTASTTRISPAALDAYDRYSKKAYGNPSSLHDTGKAAKNVLETARANMEGLLGSHEYNLIFTSGASESNSIVLSSLLWKRKPGAILVSPLEHPSVTGYRVFLKEKGYSWVVCEAPRGITSVDSVLESLSSQTQLLVLSAVHNILGT